MLDADAQDLVDIEAVLSGDAEIFERLVRRHGEAVQKQMRNFTRDPLQAEELGQDVFVEAYLSLANFRGEAPFRHWLARIATLIGYKFWKNRDRAKRNVPLSEIGEPAEAAETETEKNPEEAARILFDLLATLPDDDRLAMTLMYLERLSQDEIAGRMGWTRVTVAVRLYRARRRLKKLGETEPWKGRLAWILS
ncbi:MAG: sigma-70 family RNA polymerase sigma factor [Planctomycetota bacterium]|jgi:RNA polymerase sigma-70 factor (ECF subfamily)|nr:sigma-70 family RNA polymerase sigma factor [Planctomycetota bacterium]